VDTQITNNSCLSLFRPSETENSILSFDEDQSQTFNSIFIGCWTINRSRVYYKKWGFENNWGHLLFIWMFA